MTLDTSATLVVKTLLMTDLVDSTKLIESLGDMDAAHIFSRHDDMARRLMVRYGGTEIDKTDGFLVVFERPVDAVSYALSLHDSIAELASDANVRLAARVGIHLGEVQFRENRAEDVSRGAKPLELEGISKPTVARLMSLALGGQTLVSRTAFDLARTAFRADPEASHELVWIRHGAYRFKGIRDTQTVCEVGRTGRSPLTAPPSSAKAWRAKREDLSGDGGWRPMPGGVIPGLTSMVLERKLGDGQQGTLWLARERLPISDTETVGLEVSLSGLAPPRKRALLLYKDTDGDAAATEFAAWRQSGFVDVVVVVEGANEGCFALLTSKPLTLGRDRLVDFPLDDPKVSRSHCVIEQRDGGFYVCEMNARNGVFVNHERVNQERLLTNGDRISIGETTMMFLQTMPDQTSLQASSIPR
jgi:class 3 adenylate cyclase